MDYGNEVFGDVPSFMMVRVGDGGDHIFIICCTININDELPIFRGLWLCFVWLAWYAHPIQDI